MVPSWVNSLDELRDYVSRSHGNSVQLPEVGNGGRGIHIGLFDSVWRLPSWASKAVDVEHERTCLPDKSENYTNIHGVHVLHVISYFAPHAKFSFYQTVNEDGKVPVAAYSDAIDAAIEDGVDLINLSSGDPWKGPIRYNPLSRITRRALDEGVPIIAAAGNDDTGGKPVHCPAASKRVIAVGGFVSRCPEDIRPADHNQRTGPYYANKPGTEELSDEFCGQNGCMNGEGCLSKQEDVVWTGNPVETDGKPDVLAPVHFPAETDSGVINLREGSSFAAPIVTTAVANILSEQLGKAGKIPRPAELRTAIREGGSPVKGTDKQKLNALAVMKSLS